MADGVVGDVRGVRFAEVPRRRSLTSQLYRAARISDNISAIASGNPRRVARRAKNVALGRGGFWRWLWK